ncbi:MAG: class C beta-lactamase-related serine hydrolase [Chitinophagaceae bacterium]|nr:MAG: class C beta-lactamase-related serine hydrolase [Chitinophagaceae bacterium]
MKHALQVISLLLFGILSITSCQKEKLAANIRTFNVDKFRENLKTQINASGTPEGYSFVITKDGLVADSFSTGNARKSSAGGSTPWNTDQEINVASVTKTLTAVAVFQLMTKNDLKPIDKIGPWLPAYFNATQTIQNLSFEELLTHSSGITESSTSFDSMIAVVRRPLADPAKTKGNYANLNFALFRAMIPYLRDKGAAVQQESNMLPGNPSGFQTWLSNAYVGYMQSNVFTPIGIGVTNCKPSSNTAQAFSEPSGPTQAVANLADWTEISGGGGYFMSVLEMARFNAYLANTYSILSKENRALMDSKFMGWDPEDSRMTSAGRSYGKDGALRWDNDGNGLDPGDAGLQTLIVKYPNKVELAIAINSVNSSWRSLAGMAQTAYEASWEK